MSSKLADPKVKNVQSSQAKIDAPRPELTNQFLKTFLSIPRSQNPLAEENEGTRDDITQPGKIHFLGGVFDDPTTPESPSAIERTITVAEHQSLVMPIITQTIDNVGWDFGGEKLYQFSIDDLKYLAGKAIDTVTGLSFELDGCSVINDNEWEKYRVASQSSYTWQVPAKDDITNYRGTYPDEWIKSPYTKGVQDGYWVQLDNLSLGWHTIEFEGTFHFSQIDASVDYDRSGTIGDHPVEAVLAYVSTFDDATQDITYNVNVLSRPDFNKTFG